MIWARMKVTVDERRGYVQPLQSRLPRIEYRVMLGIYNKSAHSLLTVALRLDHPHNAVC